MPFPSTRIIPTNWSAHHRGNLATSMNATIKITDPTRSYPGAFLPESGTHEPAVEHVVAEAVDCRIEPTGGEALVDQAGQRVQVRDYLIQLPWDAPAIETGNVATVLTAEGDEQLVGKELTAVEVQYASERFTRDTLWRLELAPTATPPEV